MLEFITEVYDFIGWGGVVFMMAVESAAIPLPSEIIMPLAGWKLILERESSAWFLLLAGFYGALGNLIGSLIAYYAGAIGPLRDSNTAATSLRAKPVSSTIFA